MLKQIVDVDVVLVVSDRVQVLVNSVVVFRRDHDLCLLEQLVNFGVLHELGTFLELLGHVPYVG